MSDIFGRQRTVPVHGTSELKWNRVVESRLQSGEVFIAVYDSKTTDYFPKVAVDELSFFLRWKTLETRGRLIELSLVYEVRPITPYVIQQITKDCRVSAEMNNGSADEIASRCFEVISGDQLVTVRTTVFVASDSASASFWAKALGGLIGNLKAWHLPISILRKKSYYRLAAHCSEASNIPVRSLVKLFGGSGNLKAVFAALAEVNPTDYSSLNVRDELDPDVFTLEIFEQLVDRLAPRTDIEQLFNRVTHARSKQKQNVSLGFGFGVGVGVSAGVNMSAGQLAHFLNTEQRDTRLNEILYPLATKASAMKIIDKFEFEATGASGHLTLDGFVRYLESADNGPIRPEHLEVDEDKMHEPLSHYFISSSHNTYLTGRQFGGRSSAEMYRQVLLTGCRCIEIDLWDGKGEDQEPIVTHGKSMTTEVPLRDVLLAIRDTAFVVSDYPLIISVENHLCIDQQLKFARYCEEIFADSLLTKPLDSHPLKPGVPLPSPAALRRRILLKNKRLKTEDEKTQLDSLPGNTAETETGIGVGSDSGDALYTVQTAGDVSATSSQRTSTGNEPEMDIENMNDNDNEEVSAFVRLSHHNLSRSKIRRVISGVPSKKRSEARRRASGCGKVESKESPNILLSSEDDQQTSLPPATPHSPSTVSIHPYLSAMINYCHAVKFSSFAQADRINMHSQMSSFSELTCLSLLKTSVIDFVNYNKRHLSRIYPKGNRVDSSNYLPQIFWNAGCQLAALNYQTCDLGYQMNHAKFEYNGMCGFLLKPDCMRRPDLQLDPFSETPVDGLVAARLSVQVISGYFLSTSGRNAGCFVEVELYGLPADTIRKEFRTRVVPNCINPTFSDDPFVFRKVIFPELALVRFAVLDETGRLLGQRVIPLELLLAGYRHISLRNEFDLPLPLATLFVRIELCTYVPDSLTQLVDVLSDPLAYRSVIEKRVAAMRSMGIEEHDLAENRAAEIVEPKLTRVRSPEIELLTMRKRDEPSLPIAPLCYADVLRSREYARLTRLQAEQLGTMAKTHRKNGVGNDTVAMVTRRPQRRRPALARMTSLRPRTNINKFLSCPFQQHATADSGSLRSFSSLDEISSRSDTLQLGCTVFELLPSDQQLLQLTEECRMREEHIAEIAELVFSVVLPRLEKLQLEKLQAWVEADEQRLKHEQTRQSMESTRVLKHDKQINRAERERRVREATQSNTKRFIEERKRLAFSHSQQIDRLRDLHTQLEQDLRNRFGKETERLKIRYEERRLKLLESSIATAMD